MYIYVDEKRPHSKIVNTTSSKQISISALLHNEIDLYSTSFVESLDASVQPKWPYIS